MSFTARFLLSVSCLFSSTFALYIPSISSRNNCAPLKSQVNENEIASSKVNGSTAGIVSVASQDNKSRLASAFAALDETEQYDAVLTGLCAKILDDDTDEETREALKDPIKLMQEMNARRVTASGRSLMALIDATCASQDATAMSEMMSLCLKNGGVSKYGALQTQLTLLPSNPSTKVLCSDGSKKTRKERLDGLVEIPVDNRGEEVTSAVIFLGFAGICTFFNTLGVDGITPYSSTLFVALVIIGIFDNFYDVIDIATNIASKGKEIKLQLPEKGSLPMNLGTGQLSGSVFRGLARLTTIDTERECQCEAAAFYAAYVLGLPCFAFRPNALESAVMVVESTKKNSLLDPILSSVGIQKVLVWLLAPVAMESAKHPQLVMSDPRESSGLLERLEDKASLLKGEDMFWMNGEEEEKADILKWAYAEADLLIRDNRRVIDEISKQLASGAATVGDCVAVIEGW
mmetsp:Transcript_13481/g.20874  ORF Transcript_13481/g.20874 Transcript_13481/m.20874 type:complete len:461 (-) Transcript_13481:368-1750(-)